MDKNRWSFNIPKIHRTVSGYSFLISTPFVPPVSCLSLLVSARFCIFQVLVIPSLPAIFRAKSYEKTGRFRDLASNFWSILWYLCGILMALVRLERVKRNTVFNRITAIQCYIKSKTLQSLVQVSAQNKYILL